MKNRVNYTKKGRSVRKLHNIRVGNLYFMYLFIIYNERAEISFCSKYRPLVFLFRFLYTGIYNWFCWNIVDSDWYSYYLPVLSTGTPSASFRGSKIIFPPSLPKMIFLSALEILQIYSSLSFYASILIFYFPCLLCLSVIFIFLFIFLFSFTFTPLLPFPFFFSKWQRPGTVNLYSTCRKTRGWNGCATN